MASGKRQPSKKKRSSQNRQQRAALQARKEAAQAPQVEAQAQAKRSRWRSATPAAAPEPVGSGGEPAVSTEPVARASAPAPAAEVPEAVPSGPRSSLPERSTEPKTSLLGRLRGPTDVHLPATATGARPAPPPPVPAGGRPTTVAEAARAGKDRAVTRQATKGQPKGQTSRTTAPKAAGRTTASSRATASSAGRTSRRDLAAQRNASQPVGYRAALAGVLAAVAALLLCVLETTPVDHTGTIYTSDRIVAEWAGPALASVEHVAATTPPDGTPAAAITPKAVTDGVKVWAPGRSRERLIQALWPLSAGVVFPPLGALLTFQAVRRRRGAKVVTRASYATLLGVLLSTGLAFYFLPAIIAVIVASYQVRRAEMAALAADQAADGDVIDAEVVDG